MGRDTAEFEFVSIWDLDFGVEGLEFWDGLTGSEIFCVGEILAGVEDLDIIGRADGIEGLPVEEERGLGVDDLMLTEAQLVLSIELDLFKLCWDVETEEPETEERVTELLRADLGRLLLSDD